MKGSSAKTVAYVLLGTGLFLFLANTGVFGALPAFLWTLLLLAVGAAFWMGSLHALPLWQRIAGYAGIGVFATATSGSFAGAAALGFPALAFGLVYLLEPRRWWALLPAGLVGSVAVFIALDALFPRWDTTPILFLGFAATFSVLYLLSPRRGGKRWALFPAVLFIVLTVLSNDPSGNTPGWFMPLLLIGGGWLLLWWWRRRS